MTRAFWFHTFKGRLLLSIIIGSLISILIMEGSFFLLKDKNDRAPQRVELVIPAGTAERVAAGQAVPSIPTDMTFVVGDVLVVQNDDSVAHQLGPVWVPAGTSASLNLDQANQFAFECTFQPTRYFGLDVHSRVTFATQLQAFFLVGPATIALIAIYSLVVFPLKPHPAKT